MYYVCVYIYINICICIHYMYILYVAFYVQTAVWYQDYFFSCQ